MKLLLLRDADGAFTHQIKIGTADELKDHDPLREAVKKLKHEGVAVASYDHVARIWTNWVRNTGNPPTYEQLTDPATFLKVMADFLNSSQYISTWSIVNSSDEKFNLDDAIKLYPKAVTLAQPQYTALNDNFAKAMCSDMMRLERYLILLCAKLQISEEDISRAVDIPEDEDDMACGNT